MASVSCRVWVSMRGTEAGYSTPEPSSNYASPSLLTHIYRQRPARPGRAPAMPRVWCEWCGCS